MLKVTRGPVIWFFHLRNYFFIFLKLFEHSNFGFFFYFNAPIFYNFQNLIIFLFSKFFLINKFCKFCKFFLFKRKFQSRNFDNFRNCRNCRCLLIIKFKKEKICKITKILKKFWGSKSFWIVRLFDISHYSWICQLFFWCKFIS